VTTLKVASLPLSGLATDSSAVIHWRLMLAWMAAAVGPSVIEVVAGGLLGYPGHHLDGLME
jgi:hypothetical protein